MPLMPNALNTAVYRPPAPRVSTPAPYGVPTWDTGDTTPDLDLAYQLLYAQNSATAANTTPPVTNGLKLKSLSQWRDDSVYAKQQKDLEAKQKANAAKLAQQYPAYSATTNDDDSLSKGTLVSIAQSYIGQNRYKYGGFDCSKFTQEVAAKAGLSIPRDTASQISYFRRQGMFSGKIGDARPGDTLYFRSSASGSGRHTGIYIGNGMMIDNAGRGKPIKVRSIAGRSLIGVGRLSYLMSPRGDGGYITPKHFGYKGTPGTRPGSAPHGLQPEMWSAVQEANAALAQAGLPPVDVTSGFRSRQEQGVLRRLQPKTTAPADQSSHGIGEAADVDGDPRSLDFLRKNARPLGLIPTDEPWHMQMNPERVTRWRS